MSNGIDWFGIGEMGAGLWAGFSVKWFAKKVQKKLASLVFWQDGMREQVARIARGDGTQSDLDQIALRLRGTERETIGAEVWLRGNRARIAGTFGAELAQKLDYVAYRKMGPGAVRAQLVGIVADQSLDVQRARHVLEQIDEFNALLSKVRTG